MPLLWQNWLPPRIVFALNHRAGKNKNSIIPFSPPRKESPFLTSSFYVSLMHYSSKTFLSATNKCLCAQRPSSLEKNLCQFCNSLSQDHDYIIITPTQNYSTIDVYWADVSEGQSVPLSLLSLYCLLCCCFLSPTQVLGIFLLFSFSFSVFSSTFAQFAGRYPTQKENQHDACAMSSPILWN